MKKENVYVDTIKYVDFYKSEESRNILVYEFHDANYDNYDRGIIMFNEDIGKEYIEKTYIPMIWSNKQEIIKSLLTIEIAEEMLSLENSLDIRLVANTSEYWEDVRLFSYGNRFNYAQDVFELAAQEVAVYTYVRDNFYYDDMILSPCRKAKQYNNMYKDIEEQLAEGEFNVEKVIEVLEYNNYYNDPKVKGYFEKHILNKELSENLTTNNKKEKKVKL